MAEHKFTNDELKKCIECCIKAKTRGDCEEMKCPASTHHGCCFYLRTDEDYEDTIYKEMFKDVLELINNKKTDLDLLKSTITHKEEEAYNKGYADAKADILEKLQADIERDETLAEYGDELFEGRIAGFKAVMNYLNAEGEK